MLISTVPPGRTRPAATPLHRITVSGDVALIHLPQGPTVLVDRADLGTVSGSTWTPLVTATSVYAASSRGLMHRLLLGAASGEVVDHRDGDGLNNRRSNLRLCTHKENCRNARKHANTSSRYKGVTLDKRTGRWCAGIRVDFQGIHLGSYRTEAEAARAYDAAARYFFGEFAHTNFPGTEALSPVEIAQRKEPIRRRQVSAVRAQSGYRGVTWHARDRLWTARLYLDGRCISLGYFKVAEDAARAYDRAARQYFGEEAKTNFPHSDL